MYESTGIWSTHYASILFRNECATTWHMCGVNVDTQFNYLGYHLLLLWPHCWLTANEWSGVAHPPREQYAKESMFLVGSSNQVSPPLSSSWFWWIKHTESRDCQLQMALSPLVHVKCLYLLAQTQDSSDGLYSLEGVGDLVALKRDLFYGVYLIQR